MSMKEAAAKKSKTGKSGFGKKILSLYNGIEKIKFLTSIRQAFTLLIPVFMVGSFALLFRNPPVSGDLISAWENTYPIFHHFREIMLIIYLGTMEFSAVYVVLVVSYIYSKNFRKDSAFNILAALTALCAFLALIGVRDTKSGDFIYVYSDFGVMNMLPALIVSWISVRIYALLYKSMGRKRGSLNDDNYKTSLKAILPMAILTVAFALVAYLLYQVYLTTLPALDPENPPRFSIMSWFSDWVVSMFQNMGTESAPLAMFIQTLLWFFGMHGSNIMDQVNKGLTPDGGRILTKDVMDVFVNMGGCGTAICLLIALLIFTKLKKHRQLCRQSALPMVFNINETMIFGLPVVLNPVYFIPFLITPLVLTGNTYLWIWLGAVPQAVNIAWTTPALISGYLATGSVMGLILQLVNIIIGVAIYAPFVIMDGRLQRMKNEQMIAAMEKKVKDAEAGGAPCNLFEDSSDISSAAKELAFELREAIRKKQISMFYQPHVDNRGNVISCEALMRWKYKYGKYLYPPLVIHIAKLDHSFEILTDYIIENALADTKEFNARFGFVFDVFVNIQAQQFANADFMENLIRKTKSYGIEPYTFGIEITEETALIQNRNEQLIFNLLKENHIKIAIDDFSMGSTSLQYLFNNKFDFVKLDGSLTRNMLQNERIQEIILSITNLGKSLDFQIIAEYVETIEQKIQLEKLGCNLYQGYLYSPAIPSDALIEYVLNFKSVEI